MKLDREFQRRVLEACAEAYPFRLDEEAWTELFEEVDYHKITANLVYLQQRRLIETCMPEGRSGIDYAVQCTADCIDLICKEGSIRAALDAVTIKLHEDTLGKLIEARVLASDLPDAEKGGILQALREAPAESAKQLIAKLVDLGMQSSPAALRLIETWTRGVLQ